MAAMKWWPTSMFWRVVFVVVAIWLAIAVFGLFASILFGHGVSRVEVDGAGAQELTATPTDTTTPAPTPTATPVPAMMRCKLGGKIVIPAPSIDGASSTYAFGEDCGTITLTTKEIVVTDPSGLYQQPLDDPALAKPAPVPSPTPTTDGGFLDGLFGERSTASVAPGLNWCTWSAEWRWANVVMATFDVTTYFNIAPYSNLTDWSVVNVLDVTPEGSVFYATDFANANVYPSGWFTYPDVVSQLWTTATGRIHQPHGPIATEKVTIKLTAFTNSPGSPSYPPLCPGTWEFTQDLITDPIGGAIDTVNEWCSDHWWFCLTISGCWFMCGW